MNKLMLILFVLIIYPLPIVAKDDDDHFQSHKGRMVEGLEAKIGCFKAARNWEDMENCHHEAHLREKQDRLKELEEEQRRIKQEMKELKRKD